MNAIHASEDLYSLSVAQKKVGFSYSILEVCMGMGVPVGIPWDSHGMGTGFE